MKYRVQIKAGDGWITYTTVESLQKAFNVKRHIEDNRFEEVQITAEISTLLDLGIVDLDVRSEIFSLLADLKW